MADSFETVVKNYSGLSSETKPTIAAGNNIPNGSRWREVDTGKTYFFNLADDDWYIYGKVIDGKPRVSATPYLYDIAEGNVPGHSISNAFGSRDDVQIVTNGSDIWQGAETTIPVPADAGVQMYLVSSSAEDASDGTGIKTVKVNYLDATGAQASQVITMAGQTPVAMTNPNIRFVQGIHATTVGTGGAAAGLVTCSSDATYPTDTALTYSQIRAGYTMSLSTQRMVPLGKILYITNIYATSAVAGKAVEIRLRSTSMQGVLYPGVFLNQQVLFLETNGIPLEIPPIKVPAMAIVKFTVHVPTGKDGAYVSAGFNGWIEAE